MYCNQRLVDGVCHGSDWRLDDVWPEVGEGKGFRCISFDCWASGAGAREVGLLLEES